MKDGSWTAEFQWFSPIKVALHDLTDLDEKMREYLMWFDVKLLHALLVFLETQLWAKQLHIAGITSGIEDDSLSDNDDKTLCEVN